MEERYYSALHLTELRLMAKRLTHVTSDRETEKKKRDKSYNGWVSSWQNAATITCSDNWHIEKVHQSLHKVYEELCV